MNFPFSFFWIILFDVNKEFCFWQWIKPTSTGWTKSWKTIKFQVTIFWHDFVLVFVNNSVVSKKFWRISFFVPVTNLGSDFKDGIVLLNLIEVVTGCSIQSLGIASGYLSISYFHFVITSSQMFLIWFTVENTTSVWTKNLPTQKNKHWMFSLLFNVWITLESEELVVKSLVLWHSVTVFIQFTTIAFIIFFQFTKSFLLFLSLSLGWSSDIIEGNAQMIKALLFSLKKYKKDQTLLKRHLTSVDAELDIPRKGNKNKSKSTSNNLKNKKKLPNNTNKTTTSSSLQKRSLLENRKKRKRNVRGERSTRGRNSSLFQYDPRDKNGNLEQQQLQQQVTLFTFENKSFWLKPLHSIKNEKQTIENLFFWQGVEWEETLKSTSKKLWELNKLIHRARHLERVLEHSQNSESTDISSDYFQEARELAGLSEKR